MSNLPPVFGEGRALGLAFVTASAIGQALAAGVAAFATRDIFAGLHQGEGSPPVLSLALLFLAGAAVAGLRVLGRVVAEKMGQDYGISLRRALFRHLTRMPVGAVDKRRNGALALRFVGDLTAARNWAGLSVARIISAAIVMPGGAAVLLLLNPTLASAAALPILLSAAVMVALAPRMAPLHRQLRRRRANLAIDMMERVSAAPELLLMGRAETELNKAAKRGRQLRTAAVRRVLGAASLRSLPDLGTAAAAAALLWAAYASGAAPAEAAAALAVLGILIQPLRDLAGVWDRWCAWRIARQKCETLLSTPLLDHASGGQQPRGEGPAEIAFKQVGRGALSELDAAAAPGVKVAILGANGAGKSTCLALAAGLEHADHGSVEIDGVELRRLSPAERQRSVVYVGPRSPILQGSLRRALTLGIRPRPNDPAIEATARDFGLGELLDRLGGLDAKVSEGGRNLSSGERRRVQLVRATLSRPRLLLLDEPGEALDRAGRELVAKLVRETSATTLQVTHDLDLARQADLIWYIEAGRVREQGPLPDLLRSEGPTARLFRPRRAA